MPKFFVRENQIKENKIYIIGEDVNHILNVLRLKEEDELTIGNLDTGKSYLAMIVKKQKDLVCCKIEKELELNTESKVDITIFQGLPKADKMEWIIQKSTEIGVRKIVPVEMKRCIVKLEEKEAKKKIQRWQKIAEIAAKQSMRDQIPVIGNKEKIKDILDQIKEYDLFIIAYENEKNTTLKQILKQVVKKENLKIGILIGPEGGIDIEEVKVLEENGAKVITLGNRILRTETVALVMSSILIYELEE